MYVLARRCRRSGPSEVALIIGGFQNFVAGGRGWTRLEVRKPDLVGGLLDDFDTRRRGQPVSVHDALGRDTERLREHLILHPVEIRFQELKRLGIERRIVHGDGQLLMW